MNNKNFFSFINKYEPNIAHGGLRCLGVYKKNKNNAPLITIITTVKNGEVFFQEAIDSLQKQTYKNFEIIIINDECSNDSKLILKEVANRDSRIRVVNNIFHFEFKTWGFIFLYNYILLHVNNHPTFH